MLRKYVSAATVMFPEVREAIMRNPATGRQCYGGMKPVDQLDDYALAPTLPPPDPIPPQVSRRSALGLPKRDLVEESVE